MPTVDQFKALSHKFVTDTFSEFTHDFYIESMVKTQDGQGGFTVNWYNFANLTGFVKTPKANEIILDDHIKSENVKKFSFEYITGITTDMRLIYLGDVYNIHSNVSIVDSIIWIDLIASKDVAT